MRVAPSDRRPKTPKRPRNVAAASIRYPRRDKPNPRTDTAVSTPSLPCRDTTCSRWARAEAGEQTSAAGLQAAALPLWPAPPPEPRQGLRETTQRHRLASPPRAAKRDGSPRRSAAHHHRLGQRAKKRLRAVASEFIAPSRVVQRSGSVAAAKRIVRCSRLLGASRKDTKNQAADHRNENSKDDNSPEDLRYTPPLIISCNCVSPIEDV